MATADTVEVIVKLGGLALTALIALGGVVKFFLLNPSQEVDPLVAELRDRLEDVEKELARERSERASENALHRSEVSDLQREVRDLYSQLHRSN